jgi:hypothetical protein
MSCENTSNPNGLLLLRSIMTTQPGSRDCNVPISAFLRFHVIEAENRGLSTIDVEGTSSAQVGMINFNSSKQTSWRMQPTMHVPPSKGRKNPGTDYRRSSVKGCSAYTGQRETITTNGTLDSIWTGKMNFGPLTITVDVV